MIIFKVYNIKKLANKSSKHQIRKIKYNMVDNDLKLFTEQKSNKYNFSN